MSDVLLKQVDMLNKTEILIGLSDGRSLLLTLEQVLAANPEVIPPPPDDDED